MMLQNLLKSNFSNILSKISNLEILISKIISIQKISKISKKKLIKVTIKEILMKDCKFLVKIVHNLFI